MRWPHHGSGNTLCRHSPALHDVSGTLVLQTAAKQDFRVSWSPSASKNTGVSLDKTSSVPTPHTQLKKIALVKHAGSLLIIHQHREFNQSRSPRGSSGDIGHRSHRAKAQAAQGINSPSWQHSGAKGHGQPQALCLSTVTPGATQISLASLLMMSGDGYQQGENSVPLILSHHLNCCALPLAMPIQPSENR